MLPRGKRLTRATFGPVMQGKRATSAHFSVTVRSSALPQAAVVVSKKVAKRSVDRHLLKRRVLAAAAPYVRGERSFIVYARAGSPALSFAALQAELVTLLTNALKV